MLFKLNILYFKFAVEITGQFDKQTHIEIISK